MPSPITFSAALVAGGKSMRMGRDKALLMWPGTNEVLWQHQLRTLQELTPEEIFWSGPMRPGVPPDVRVVADAVDNAGPLGGISACLENLRSDLLIVLAIDLPRMTSLFLRLMLARSSSTCGVVVRRGDYYEPLAAIYPKSVADLATEHLARGEYALQALVRAAVKRNLVTIVPLDEKDVPLFRNVNSPGDM
jgi:molybdopterin-guanine dinucleotide biosynthesis protein A